VLAHGVLLFHGMKLVVDHAKDHGDSAVLRDDAGTRPALRIIEGGRARPSRLAAPRTTPAPPAPAPSETVLDLDEVTIYLRPIPAWVPRLW
jgi:hypothetical protein